MAAKATKRTPSAARPPPMPEEYATAQELLAEVQEDWAKLVADVTSLVDKLQKEPGKRRAPLVGKFEAVVSATSKKMTPLRQMQQKALDQKAKRLEAELKRMPERTQIQSPLFIALQNYRSAKSLLPSEVKRGKERLKRAIEDGARKLGIDS